MEGLSLRQKRMLTPTCQPSSARLIMFMLVSGLAVVLLGCGLPVPEVLTVLGAATLATLMVTSSISASSVVGATGAVLARICAPTARHVLTRAAVAL